MSRPRFILVAAALAALAAPTAHAAEFTILIFESKATLAERDGAAAESYWSRFNAYAGELAAAGVLRGGSALSETSGGFVRGATGAVKDGSARLGGYLVIDAPDLAAAEGWALKAPADAAAVAVLPHRANPMMDGPAKP